MSFTRYEDCRDSGVEWIGMVPSHWAVQRLKRHARLLTEKTDRREHQLALENIESWTGRFVPTETEFEGEGVAFDPGDVLFGKLRPYLAKTLVAESSGEAVGDFLVMRPTHASKSRFLAYQLRSREVISIVDSSTFGSKMPRASWDFVGAMPTPLPPAKEQTAIVTFLDRETDKIDVLVEEQRRLIDLLKEKRQAVISQAVTKGLDPNVPKRDSGVEWLGKVPAHWGVIRVKAASTFLTSGPRGWSDHVSDEGALFVQSGDLTEALGIDFDNAKRVVVADDAEAKRTQLKVGDVLVCITGAKTGKVAVFEQTDEPAFINQHICLIRPAAGLRPTYLGAYLHSAVGQRYFELAQYGLKQGLSLENVKQAAVPVPPRTEQDHIVDHVNRLATELDNLTAAAEMSIALLHGCARVSS